MAILEYKLVAIQERMVLSQGDHLHRFKSSANDDVMSNIYVIRYFICETYLNRLKLFTNDTHNIFCMLQYVISWHHFIVLLQEYLFPASPNKYCFLYHAGQLYEVFFTCIIHKITTILVSSKISPDTYFSAWRPFYMKSVVFVCGVFLFFQMQCMFIGSVVFSLFVWLKV